MTADPVDAAIAEMLAIDTRDPCLVLRRQTLSQNQVASVATMWHPGSSYQFAGSVGNADRGPRS